MAAADDVFCGDLFCVFINRMSLVESGIEFRQFLRIYYLYLEEIIVVSLFLLNWCAFRTDLVCCLGIRVGQPQTSRSLSVISLLAVPRRLSSQGGSSVLVLWWF